VKEHQKLRNDIFYFVRNEHLAAVKLDFVLLQRELLFNFWEVEYAREVKGIVYVEVNPEKRVFVGRRVKFFVKASSSMIAGFSELV